jgi:hypothetical protein
MPMVIFQDYLCPTAHAHGYIQHVIYVYIFFLLKLVGYTAQNFVLDGSSTHGDQMI